MNMSTSNRLAVCLVAALLAALVERPSSAAAAERPNILWLVVEDASPHLPCYGETTVPTPHIDALAGDGVRFASAFVTSPVCSSSRSAMVTGMYPVTLGTLHHRSQRESGKGGGNKAYYASYHLPVRSVPELFRESGYYVTNSGINKSGKQDYNFTSKSPLYDPMDWASRKAGQPFFAQVQLQGGKARRAKVDQPVDPRTVKLPPYYPDHPVVRADWATYLNSWIKTDNEVGGIMARLKREGVLKNTVIFFLTDHGVSHLRGKQFLYDEGIRIPLIVRFGDGAHAGTVRNDLVEHIDIAAASLALAGIPIPAHIQGRPLFAKSHEPREFVFAARDRCDETVEILRAVRTGKYKYIRNFLSFMPHAQPNQYKDGKLTVQTMRGLFFERKLTEIQSRPFLVPRPVDELYDLENDQHETVNLADAPKYADVRNQLAKQLYRHMDAVGDLGLIPEPILEDIGRRLGSKYRTLQEPADANLGRRLRAVISAGERDEREKLRRSLKADRPSLRYWAATWLGLRKDNASTAALAELAKSDVPAVRVAAALALCRLGRHDEYVPMLASLIRDDNLIVGMYAIRALEQVGQHARPALPQIQAARDSPYEFTKRYARRLTAKLGGS